MAHLVAGSRSRLASKSIRRKTSWGAGPRTVFGGQTLNSSAKVLANTGFAFSVTGTLVRIRGELLWFSRSATAPNDGLVGAFGIGFVTDQAFAIGATAIPGPHTQPEWEGWIWHRYVHCFAGGRIVVAAVSEQTDAVQPTAGSLRIEIDSKAMRKFSENMTMVLMSEMTLNGTMATTWHAQTRILVKLH